MNKLKFVMPFLILAVLVLMGAGCGEKEPGEESLTDILSKAKDIVAYKYEAVITTPGQPVITAKFWLKENKMRWEGSLEGKNVVYLIDEDKLTAYLYIPAQKIAMKMNFWEAQDTVGESPTEQSGSVMDYNPVTLGTEVLDGKTCLVIEYTDETGKTKMWLWTRYGIPIRTEVTTAKGITIVELKNIDFGNISDSMFELPAGVQIMTIPSFGF
ncbi:MAG: outer membrane lipoprotein carrier protein LolA [Candidatus Portnoybacteria bacterium]|nr:outer membrane lipoprotein carrier protein LolA [Candidatus Portnoybacteria bacterium]